MESYRLVLADDHLMFRQGIKKILEENGDIEVIGEANDGLELLNLLKKISPESILEGVKFKTNAGTNTIKKIEITNLFIEHKSEIKVFLIITSEGLICILAIGVISPNFFLYGLVFRVFTFYSPRPPLFQ